MANANAGVPRMFAPWGGKVKLTISATEYVLYNLVPGSLSMPLAHKEKVQVFDNGLLSAVLEGNVVPGQISFAVNLVNGAGAGELPTLLAGAGTNGEAQFFDVSIWIYRALGSANYEKYDWTNCYLAEQPVISEPNGAPVQMSVVLSTKDNAPTITSV